ncbi:bifunctional DNA primase/polymerase [Tateyamaria sp.]|uniref:bifunctional DNA primase/polymerase n=1 Tax=Tateyamaria sp. TaxID=1929288 RepID=UPI00329F0230
MPEGSVWDDAKVERGLFLKSTASWQEQAERHKTLATFPIRIERNGARWLKKPLVKYWQRTSVGQEWRSSAWSKANGYGILIRDGLVMVDVDPYKDGAEDAARAWFEKFGLPRTRTHRTISGGWHFFFRVPAKYADLPTRVNVVQNVDIRGGLAANGEDRPTSRGFAAFGAGYQLVRDIPMAMLTDAAAKDIASPSRRAGPVITAADLGGYIEPDDIANLMARLAYWLQWNVKLEYRFKGIANGIDPRDRSRSQIDMSVAGILTRLGFTHDEIVYVLLHVLETGSARYAGNEMVQGMPRCLRQALRAATAAQRSFEERKEDLKEAAKKPTLSRAAVMAVIAKMRGEP